LFLVKTEVLQTEYSACKNQFAITNEVWKETDLNNTVHYLGRISIASVI